MTPWHHLRADGSGLTLCGRRLRTMGLGRTCKQCAASKRAALNVHVVGVAAPFFMPLKVRVT